MMMFGLGPPLMLLTTLTFTIGSLLEKMCQPMLDLSLFSDVSYNSFGHLPLDINFICIQNIGSLVYSEVENLDGVHAIF